MVFEEKSPLLLTSKQDLSQNEIEKKVSEQQTSETIKQKIRDFIDPQDFINVQDSNDYFGGDISGEFTQIPVETV